MKGKLSPEQLKRCIFDIIKKRRLEVLSGAAVAEDCAVLKLDGLVLMSSDPITAASDNAGKLAIEVSVNDIAACGGEPVAALLTIIAPESCDEKDIIKVMQDAEQAAYENNVEICGGHTEFSDAVNRLIVSATIIGITDKAILSSTPEEGDSVIITKHAALEGTYIIYNELKGLLQNHLNDTEIAEAKTLSGSISVLKESQLLKGLNISAMHDITEGGVIGAVKEMCVACGKGAEIYLDKVPLLSLTKKIAKLTDINPYKLISSGSMLITTSQPQQVIDTLKKNGILATIIGKITLSGAYYIDGEKKYPLSVDADEIVKLSEIKRRLL